MPTPVTQKRLDIHGGQELSPPIVTYKAAKRNYYCHASTQKTMYKASIFLNDLLKAAAHFNKTIPKHKIDWTNCCGGRTQQLIKIIQDFYS